MKSAISGLVLILMLFCSCNRNISNSEDKHRTENLNNSEASAKSESETVSLNSKNCKPLESIILEEKMPKSMGKYEVKNMEQKGDCLRITIKHSGKTSLAKFHLVWNGAVMKSLPPIAILKLEGSIFEDSGKSVTQELDFNLDALKTFGKIITIRLGGHEVSPVRFSFE